MPPRPPDRFRLRAIFDAVAAGVVYVNPDGKATNKMWSFRGHQERCDNVLRELQRLEYVTEDLQTTDAGKAWRAEQAASAPMVGDVTVRHVTDNIHA